MRKTTTFLSFAVFLIVISIACAISFDSGAEEDQLSPAEQTLQAIYLQETVDAQAAANNAQTDAQAEPPEDDAAPVITHTTIPGNPGSPDQTKDEIDTSNTADDKIALGDSFRLGNFERPFTRQVMDYKQENDLLELNLSEDDDFYIFSLEVVGPGDAGYPSASYGIEFDTDFDGRGDVLLWAKGGDYQDWTIDGVSVLRDSNEDVGGSRPVLPDNDDGNGYDEVLFSPDVLNDPDAAWQRVDPGNASIIQLAIKKDLVDGSRFFWKGWADSGLADPARFDYNDSFSEEQAGSTNENSSLYPIDQLNLMDSTCWIAYKYPASGLELGGCYQLQPEPEEPTNKLPPPPQCPSCGGCTGLSQECCLQCPNCCWNGNCYPCIP